MDTTTPPPGLIAAGRADWPYLLRYQLDLHWDHQVRPRLEGLTDPEYLWEPTPGWNVRPRGSSTAPVQAGSGAWTIDFALPPPEPAPVTTIAWRIAHVVVAVLAMRSASHFGGPEASYQTWDYAGTADAALAQLDTEMARWRAGVAGLDEAALAAPCGPAEGPYADAPLGMLVLHVNREIIHHMAEVALLRDLWAHTHTSTERTTDSQEA